MIGEKGEPKVLRKLPFDVSAPKVLVGSRERESHRFKFMLTAVFKVGFEKSIMFSYAYERHSFGEGNQPY